MAPIAPIGTRAKAIGGNQIHSLPNPVKPSVSVVAASQTDSPTLINRTGIARIRQLRLHARSPCSRAPWTFAAVSCWRSRGVTFTWFMSQSSARFACSIGDVSDAVGAACCAGGDGGEDGGGGTGGCARDWSGGGGGGIGVLTG